MRNPIALICALIMTCLTGLAHATHLKGGSLTWKKDTGAGGFVVDAEVIINFDLSASAPLLYPVNPAPNVIRQVNGKPFYQPGDIVGTSGATLYWGDGDEVNIDRFEVVSVDPAAQIVSAKAIETATVDLSHPYVWTSQAHFDMQFSANARDTEEELVNRTNTDMLIGSRVTQAVNNTPPSFSPTQSNLVIVEKGTDLNPVVTFNVPVATDADGDTVKYSFIEHESDASNLNYDGNDTPWEKLPATAMSITDAGVISWDTSEIDQTIQTYCIQVVAKDYASGSSVAKSSTTLEFQVWVNDTEQEGVPEIVLSPSTSVIHVYPGEKAEFEIIGYDHGENSRLELIRGGDALPPGAVLLPTAGFAGGGHDHGGDEDEDEQVSCYFSWTPTTAELGQEYEMTFKFQDEDGHESDEVTTTVVVVTAPPAPEPLELTVTDVIYSQDSLGTEVTFSATGTCATPGLELSLYTDNAIPEGAGFYPVLPVRGASSVTSTFTWLADPGFMTHPGEPIVINILVGDSSRRVTSKKVNLVIGPPPPVVTLAAGTTVPIPATAWDTLIVNFDATGGHDHHTTLFFDTENAGTVEKDEMESPASNRVIWKVVPGQILNGALRVRVTDEWGGSTVLSVPIALANPTAPTWWDSTNPAEDVLTGGAAADFGMANQGQLKAIASRAFAQLEVEFPDLATATPQGVLLSGFIGGFAEDSGNYEPLLQGHLKNAAKLFYDAIGAATGKGEIGYPWPKDASDDHNNSPATVGQVKLAFSFPQPLGGVIFNEPPSAVAITSPTNGQHYMGPQDITVQASASDVDGNLDRVEFYEDGVLFATDTTAPYEGIFDDAPVGSHVLTAKAIDTQGLERTSSAVTVTVDSSAPTYVAITSPTAGAHSPAGKQVSIQVAAGDPDNNLLLAYLYEGANQVQVVTLAGLSSFQMNWDQSTPGTYELRVKVVDGHGQELTSDPLTLVRDYNPPPTISLIKPLQNEKFPIYPSQATVELQAAPWDADGVKHVEFFVGPPGGPMVSLGTTQAPYQKTWTTSTAGSYVFQAKAVDIYGASDAGSIDQRTITVVTPTTLTYQDGNGMVDTYIRKNLPNQTNGGNAILSMHEDTPIITTLMKWSLPTNLTNAKVLEAKMTFNVPASIGGWLEIKAYALTRSFDETTASWNTTGSSGNWGTPGGAEHSSDYSSTALGTLSTNGAAGSKDFVFDANGRAKIEGWITGTATNDGFKIKQTGNWHNHAIEVSSSEAATASERPKLNVIYWVP